MPAVLEPAGSFKDVSCFELTLAVDKVVVVRSGGRVGGQFSDWSTVRKEEIFTIFDWLWATAPKLYT